MVTKNNKELANESVSKGIRLSQSGNYRAAILQFNNAIELSRSSSMAYYSRGITYMKLREETKAFDDFGTARDLAEKDGNQNLIREIDLLFKVRIRDLEQALKAAEKVLEELHEKQRRESESV